MGPTAAEGAGSTEVEVSAAGAALVAAGHLAAGCTAAVGIHRADIADMAGADSAEGAVRCRRVIGDLDCEVTEPPVDQGVLAGAG